MEGGQEGNGTVARSGRMEGDQEKEEGVWPGKEEGVLPGEEGWRRARGGRMESGP